MIYYFIFMLGIFSGSIVSMFFISKDLKKEYHLKYQNDIDQYKEIIEEQQFSIDSLQLQLAELRSYDAISPEVTD